MVPDAFGVDHRNRALLANPQTVRFGAIDLRHEPKFRKAPFQVIPRFEAGVLGAALRLGLIATEKDVTADAGNLQTCR
jgi:hypothetical protein